MFLRMVILFLLIVVLLDGFNGDSCYTFAVGEISSDVKQLLKVTKESLYLGIEQAVAGNHLGDIGLCDTDYCQAIWLWSCARSRSWYWQSYDEDPCS